MSVWLGCGNAGRGVDLWHCCCPRARLNVPVTHTHTQTHKDTHRHTHTDTQRYTETHTQTHKDTHRHTHTDTQRHTQTHTHRHTKIHTDTHTQTHRHCQDWTPESGVSDSVVRTEECWGAASGPQWERGPVHPRGRRGASSCTSRPGAQPEPNLVPHVEGTASPPP